MNSEQNLLNQWRDLTFERQQEVLDFIEFIWQKSAKDKQIRSPENKTSHSGRVKQWINWAESHSKNSPGLPDEALRRDNIYD